MVKVKGVYEWKLVNAESGEIEGCGKQNNLVTDAFLYYMTTSGTTIAANSYYIFLNGYTTPLPAYDFRQYYKVWDLISGANHTQSGALGCIYDAGTNKFTISNNFGPPGSPRIISIIGLHAAFGTAMSFIELTTPVTQQATQYLYIQYVFYVEYVATGNVNDANNNLLRNFYNVNLNSYLRTLYQQSCYITGYLPPANKDNCMSLILEWYSFYGGTYNIAPPSFSAVATNVGSPFAKEFNYEFNETSYAGPIGAIVSAANGYAQGAYPRTMTPSISRVFVHPLSRKAQIFSDAAYPPSSQGQLLLTGTPTNDVFMTGRIYITRTGDASDIIDETFLPAAVNTGSETITLTQAFGIGDKVRFTNAGGALPSPVTAGVDYYIVSTFITETFLPAAVNTGTSEITIVQSLIIDDIVRFTNAGGALPTGLSTSTDYYVVQGGTVIKVSTSQGGGPVGLSTQGTGAHSVILRSTKVVQLSTSQGGSPVNISDQGTGTHTIFRQNTGRYRLELMPQLTDPTRYVITYMPHLNVGIDFDGNLYNYADTASVNPGLGILMMSKVIIGTTKKDGYLYTVQRCGNYLNTLRQKAFTIESPVALTKFGGVGTTGLCSVRGTGAYADHFYIATNLGIYDYNLSTPSVTPVLLTVSGILSNDIRDIDWDPITQMLWTGHSTGLSKINVGALTATTYTVAGGQLAGLSGAEVTIYAGQLQAYNGYVLRGGIVNSSSNTTVWLLKDGVGYYKPSIATTWSVGLDKFNEGRIIIFASVWNIYTVTVTGVGTGSVTLVENRASALGYTSSDSNVMQTGRDMFMVIGESAGYSWSGKRVDSIHVGNGVFGGSWYPFQTAYYLNTGWGTTQSQAACWRNRVDVGNGLEIGSIAGDFYSVPLAGNSYSPYFGWDGATWELGNINDRYIPKTSTHALLDGLTADFNNSTGVIWDQQFVLGESFTFMYGPGEIKDNLQRYRLQARKYACVMRSVSSYAITPTTVSVPIPERADPDFRDMDIQPMVLSVKEGSTAYTSFTLPSVTTYTLDSSTDILTVGINIATGTPLLLTNSGGLRPTPIHYEKQNVFFAINVNTTTIRVARTYAEALINTYVNFSTNGTGTNSFQKVEPTTGTYRANLDGHFIIAAADIGKNLTLDYNYTMF